MGHYKNKKLRKQGKPFGAIEIATIDSPEWQCLSKIEAHAYNTLKTFYRGNGDGFKASFDALKRRTRIKHGQTLAKAIEGLESKQWIQVVRGAKHGKRRGLRVRPNEYRLTFIYDHKRW